MKRSLRRSEAFLADFEIAYRWYFQQAGEAVARHFLESVWQTLEMLVHTPAMGTARRFSHSDLQDLHSLRVRPPFQAHLLFYRFSETDMSVERLMHGRRDLPRRLVDAPGVDD